MLESQWSEYFTDDNFATIHCQRLLVKYDFFVLSDDDGSKSFCG